MNGGFIPHARQGGKGADAVAVPGSKVAGTGFEKEQIGQIQVAFTGFSFGDSLLGDEGRGSGEGDLAETDGLATSLLDLPGLFFKGLGYSVIFGDDLRNPA